MKRPELREIPIERTMRPGTINVTMSPGQWDGLLKAAYDAGHYLIEIDKNEKPVKAYQKRPDA
ncbi:MAG: hypothetical protein WCO53_14795 [Deltaproteobacteria bacterium]